MEQQILIGLYIGSGSACAAVMLSDKNDRKPTQISWPQGRKLTVPLRVCYEDRNADASFQWGDQVAETSADTLFGLCAFADSFYSHEKHPAAYQRLIDSLHAKRGMHHFHLPWSVYADLSSISDAHLVLFIRSVKHHLMESLGQIYSEVAMRMTRSLCIAVPPHLSSRQADGLKKRIRELFKDVSDIIRFIPQPHAAFLCLDYGARSALQIGDYLIACHMEETITTISVLRSTDHSTIVEHRLTFIRGVTLDVGTNDVLDAFQLYVEDNGLAKVNAAFRHDKLSASNVQSEITNTRMAFAGRIKDVSGEEPERVRINAVGLRLMIPVEDIQDHIFGPVLRVIISHLQDQIEYLPHEDSTKFVLLSGALAESTYVHNLIEQSLSHSAVTFDSADEALSCSLGAVTYLIPGPLICDSGSANSNRNVTYGYTGIADETEDWITRQENSVLKSRDTTDPSEQRVITRRLSMMLAKRQTNRGINDNATKSTYLLLATLHQDFDSVEEGRCLVAGFARDYSMDRCAALGPRDTRSSLLNLHLAASLGDTLAIKIMLTDETSFKINAKHAVSGEHKDHTPLELYVWYCKDDDDCIELLLELGADDSIPAAAGIAARRGSTKLLKVFESWRPAYFRRNSANLLCLALIGYHHEAAVWLLGFCESEISRLPFFETEDPLTKRPIPREAIQGIFSRIADKDPSLANILSADKRLLLDIETPKDGLAKDGAAFVDSLFSDDDFRPDLTLVQLHKESRGSNVHDQEDEVVDAILGPHNIEGPLIDEQDWPSLSVTKVTMIQTARSDPISCSPAFPTTTVQPDQNLTAQSKQSNTDALTRKASDHIGSMDKEGRDIEGRTELSLAASRGALTTVISLLTEQSNEVNLNSWDYEGRTPLCWATINNHAGIVEYLLGKGADPHLPDREGRSPISWAAARNNDLPLTYLIAHSDINCRDYHGRTPLSLAATSISSTAVGCLLASGMADVDNEDTTGRTALSWAAESGVPATIWLLLKHGASPFLVDASGHMALYYVTPSGRDEVRCILECYMHGLRGRAYPLSSSTKAHADGKFLREAVKARSEVVASIVLGLLEKNVDFGVEGDTVLHLAARNGDERIVRLLLENKHGTPDIDDMDQARTPLHLAAEEGHLLVVKELLKHGADTTLTTELIGYDRRPGRTALELASERNSYDIVAVLQRLDRSRTPVSTLTPVTTPSTITTPTTPVSTRKVSRTGKWIKRLSSSKNWS